MEIKEILSKCDHTLLKQTATWQDIKAVCEDAVKYKTASVCIPPSFVSKVREEFPKLRITTVIGFPNGYSVPAIKAYEAEVAVDEGADEIDMVSNIGLIKEGRFDLVQKEIEDVRRASEGRILKVIIETCLLTDEEKIKMCKVVTDAGADFIKTSTGFSTGGATLEDVKLLAEHVGEGVSVKAAGGIATLEDAEAFINAGASRLGTSRVVEAVKKA